MKWMTSFKLGMTSVAILMSMSTAYALRPIQGWYGGFILGGSKAPNIGLNLIDPYVGTPVTGTLYNSLLGNIGGEVGYRFNNLRVEGEVFYNNNSYSHMQIGDLTIANNRSGSTNPLQLKGFTNTYAAMLNGFYDFYLTNYTNNWVPYVGLGVGYAYVQNKIQFSSFSPSPYGAFGHSLYNISQFTNNLAGQAIVGMSYFLTDFTSFSLDFRYFSTATSHNNNEVNEFQGRPQLYTINVVFKSSFNLT